MKKVKPKPDKVVESKAEKLKRLKPKPKRPKKKGTGKGALIKGMTKHLPQEILDNPLFQQGLSQIMRGYSGIYALYQGSSLYYVGLTKDLLNRIRWHQKDRLKGKWNYFSIFRIKRINYLKDIETLLLELIKPKGNNLQGRVPKDADMNRLLRNILWFEQAEINKIRKSLQ